MVVLISTVLPPAVRGKLKLWFVEPKPGVFVSGIKDSLADRVIQLITTYTPSDAGFLLFRSITRAPGYEIYVHGTPPKELANISGFQLIIEKFALSTDPLPDWF